MPGHAESGQGRAGIKVPQPRSGAAFEGGAVAACCPNCHRAIHFGKDGDTLNETLREKIAAIEDE
jgi:hypothetical protein